MVTRREQEWKQRAEEMRDGRVTKMVYDVDLPGKRPRGKPRKSWRNNFNQYCMHLLIIYINVFSYSALVFYFVPVVITGFISNMADKPLYDDVCLNVCIIMNSYEGGKWYMQKHGYVT